MITIEMPKTLPAVSPLVLILLATILWSTGGLFIKMTTLDAFSVNAGRSFFAILTVALFTYRKGLKLDSFTLLTAFLYAGTLTCFVFANKATTAANAIFLQATAPVYILILSPFILGEKFRFADLLIVACCLGGMSFFFFETAGGGNQLASNIFLGNMAALASGAFLALYYILLRHRRSLQKNPALSVFYGNILVVVLMLPFLVSRPPAPKAVDGLAILFLGVFQIGIAYVLFTKGIAEGVRSFDAGIIGYVEPLLNPVWVFLILGERPSNWAILGGAIIITTVVAHTLLTNRVRAKSTA